MITGFDVEQLIANVTKVRLERGLSIQAVADETEMPRSTLSHLLQPGRAQPPKLATAVKLMHWLGDYDIRDYLLEER